MDLHPNTRHRLRIFHYSPWYTYKVLYCHATAVENLSLFALIYLVRGRVRRVFRWESFIIRLDILIYAIQCLLGLLRIFHYSPWYTYCQLVNCCLPVENLSLFALIYLTYPDCVTFGCWESFIIRLDILTYQVLTGFQKLRIFHYSPWYTYPRTHQGARRVENLSLFALIYLSNQAFTLVRDINRAVFRKKNCPIPASKLVSRRDPKRKMSRWGSDHVWSLPPPTHFCEAPLKNI